MTEDTESKDKEARMKAQMLGTVTPPQTAPCDSPLKMPSLDKLRRPFNGPQTVAYFYCNNCSLFGEIGRDWLNRFLDVVDENAAGPVWDAAKRDQFDGRSKFIVAYGCPQCSPGTAMTVVDIPADPKSASDTHDAEDAGKSEEKGTM